MAIVFIIRYTSVNYEFGRKFRPAVHAQVYEYKFRARKSL